MTLKLDEAKLAIDLENLQTRINSLNSENRLIIDRMQTLREAGILNQDIAKGLDSEFQINDATLQDLFLQQKNKMDIKNQLMQKMQIQMLKEISELTAVSAYAVIAIREDLDIPTEKTKILDNYRESIGFMENSLPGFIDEVWRKVTPERNG